MEKELTSSNEVELHLFKLAFNEPEAIGLFAEKLEPDWVGLPFDKVGVHELYTALITYYRHTGLDPVDPLAFCHWLEDETNVTDAMGGIDMAKEFVKYINGIEESMNPNAVISAIKHKVNKKRQLEMTQELSELLANKSLKTDKEIERIKYLTTHIIDMEYGDGADPLASVTTALDIADRASTLTKLPEFLPTPFKSLNQAMGYRENAGFYRGAVHAIIGKSGVGKSTLAKCLMNYWADIGYTALFINFEEVQAHWETTLFTQVIQENVYKNAEDWTDAQKEEKVNKFRQIMNKWGDRFMVKHDPDSSYFSDLEDWLRHIMAEGSRTPDVVFIDTIQSLMEKGKGSRWAEFEYIMIRLEKLARDMNAAFIITAQQNADAMKENREMVKQSDTGGSITIQQKSSITMFLTPKSEVDDDDSEDETVMLLQLPKNRITGTVYTMNPPMLRYNDETKSYEEYEVVADSFYQPEGFSMSDFGDLD